MSKTILMNFTVDKENRKINVERSFDAPLDLVWRAWTEAEILDKWWAPKPWKAVTRTMDFKTGGYWHYAMEGPAGEKHWSICNFISVDPKSSFETEDAFCDENKVINETTGRSIWTNRFVDDKESTTVLIELNFTRLEDLEGMIQMGFKEGFTMGLGNLDELLKEMQS